MRADTKPCDVCQYPFARPARQSWAAWGERVTCSRRCTGIRRSRSAGWTMEATGALVSMWLNGVTTAEIARQMGRTKNEVIGKANRLHLPPRPSPIKRKVAA